MSVSQFRFPSWHHCTYEPNDSTGNLVVLAVEYLMLAPLFWFIFPLIRAIVSLPLALVRSVLSSTRWIEAVCQEPAEIRIVWRTQRHVATEAAQEIARRLSRGYENLTPPDAELVSMTEPPGVSDLPLDA